MSPDEDVPRVEESADESPETPEDFHTVTLAELYLRQGHLRLAERVLEKILRQEPRNEKATELLREVRDRLQPEGSVQRQAAVKAELSRWLDNIARMRGHAT
jgi:Tfp pilus assembly protein PilF